MQKKVDRYELAEVIGEGAWGKVYRAWDPKLEREVAVKLLNAECHERVRERFRLEARAIAALKQPNIVALLDFSGESSEQLFLVMEYVPGRSLYELTHELGNMSEPTALCVAHELALALEHAHSHRVVHRDVKPENVLLHDGRIVLTDFGGVKLVSREGRGAHSRTEILGTPGFMAPEQFAGRDIGPYTDVFALGATIYNLTTGEIPYEGGSIEETHKNLKSGRYVDPRSHAEILSPQLCKLLGRCLAPKPGDRFAYAARLRGRVRELLGQHGVVEVREELQRYEKSPAKTALVQRDRSVGVVLKELSEALRARNVDRARELAERARALAPLDARTQQLAGDGRVMKPLRPAGSRLGIGLAIGGLAGLCIGVLCGYLFFA